VAAARSLHPWLQAFAPPGLIFGAILNRSNGWNDPLANARDFVDFCAPNIREFYGN
jgi:hypothetical protein